MDVTMHDRLTGDHSDIDTDVKSFHLAILFFCGTLCFLKKEVARPHLGGAEFEKDADVSFRDYQTVKRSNGVTISNDNREFVGSR
jgi:hypothetical protein